MADYKFDFVVRSRLRNVFDVEVVPRLPAICRKAGIQWSAAVLFELLENSTLLLGSITKSDKIVGIVILQECTNMFTAARYLHVWVAHFSREVGLLSFFEKIIDELADVFSYSYVQFSSLRKGWHRLQSPEWKLAYTVWEKHYE